MLRTGLDRLRERLVVEDPDGRIAGEGDAIASRGYRHRRAPKGEDEGKLEGLAAVADEPASDER